MVSWDHVKKFETMHADLNLVSQQLAEKQREVEETQLLLNNITKEKSRHNQTLQSLYKQREGNQLRITDLERQLTILDNQILQAKNDLKHHKKQATDQNEQALTLVDKMMDNIERNYKDQGEQARLLE